MEIYWLGICSKSDHQKMDVQRCSDENMIEFYFRSSLNCFRLSSFHKKYDHLFFVTTSVCWLMNQARVCVFCCDMFLSTTAVILLLVYFFGHIFLETPSVHWKINQSRVFVCLSYLRSYGLYMA